MSDAFTRLIEARCDADNLKSPKEIGFASALKIVADFVCIVKLVTAQGGNASRQLRTDAALQCVSQNLSRLRTKRTIVRSENEFLVDVNHEEKSVLCKKRTKSCIGT